MYYHWFYLCITVQFSIFLIEIVDFATIINSFLQQIHHFGFAQLASRNSGVVSVPATLDFEFTYISVTQAISKNTAKIVHSRCSAIFDQNQGILFISGQYNTIINSISVATASGIPKSKYKKLSYNGTALEILLSYSAIGNAGKAGKTER